MPPRKPSATVNLVKLAAGIRSIEELRQRQAEMRASSTRPGQEDVVLVFTRMTPKREGLTEGGSLYWIFKGHIQYRQRILGIEQDRDPEGKPYALLILDPELVAVQQVARKPFIGWRYLEKDKTPPDLNLSDAKGDDLPDTLKAELSKLGLL